MNTDNVFCANRTCANTKCLRHYIYSPDDNSCSWFAYKPLEHEKCKYFIYKKEKYTMKFMNLKVENLKTFFALVDGCEGKVYLQSPDMMLNLKSKLCQYMSFAKLCGANSEEIKELDIVVENPKDREKLINFMMNGNK